jgi:hypothetical protein
VITLLWLIHPVGDLPHKEVHPGDEIPSNACNIIVVGIQNNESFILEMSKIMLNVGDKCVYTYLASLIAYGSNTKS